MKKLALLLCLAVSAPALAEDQLLTDFEIAADAVRRGEILPLADILERLSAVQPGRVIEVEIEIENGLRIYEIELITPDGRLVEVDINASTGEVLSLQEDDDRDDDDRDDDDRDDDDDDDDDDSSDDSDDSDSDAGDSDGGDSSGGDD